MFLQNKNVVVMGIANKKSIAWGCANALKDQGANVIYTYQNERMKKQVVKLADENDLLVECDVASDASIQAAFETIKNEVGTIDGLVHAIAFAKKEELSDISSYSLLAVTHYAKPLLNPGSGIVTLTYLGSERAIPNYNMMGIAKASLETAVKYLAFELAADKIRVNGISAGAIKTLAVTGVKDYDQLISISNERTPDKTGVTIEEVGNTCAFLVSELASGVVGDIIYVDKGVHLT